MFRAKHGPVDRFRDDCDDHGAFPSTAAGLWGEVETAKPGGGFRPTPPGHRVGDWIPFETQFEDETQAVRKFCLKKKRRAVVFFWLEPGWWLLLGKSSVSCELRWKLMLHTRSNRIHSTTSKRGTRPSNVLTCPAPISTVVPKFLSVHTSPLTQAVFPQTRAQLPAMPVVGRKSKWPGQTIRDEVAWSKLLWRELVFLNASLFTWPLVCWKPWVVDMLGPGMYP